MQYRRTTAFVNLSAIKHNVIQHIKNIKSPNPNLMAVVKANGYGHGSKQVLRTAIEAGASWAGVSSVEEAIEIRENDTIIPILLMGGWYPEAIPAFLEYNITPSLFNIELAKELSKQALKRNQNFGVHLKLETGMGRLGFTNAQLKELLDNINDFKGIQIDGVFSHLSSADEENQDFTDEQILKFWDSVQAIKKFFSPKWYHIANSAGTSAIRSSKTNLFRLGISMYGQPTLPKYAERLSLKEAITWKSSIAHIQKYPANKPIGYNRTYITKRNSTIATVCVGYADGLSRHLSNKGKVLVKGRRVPIVGRVCMDMFMIDITDVPESQIHDEVVLIGQQGSEYISATEMASWIGTINYEVVCAISSRVPRVYVEQ